MFGSGPPTTAAWLCLAGEVGMESQVPLSIKLSLRGRPALMVSFHMRFLKVMPAKKYAYFLFLPLSVLSPHGDLFGEATACCCLELPL